MGPFGVTEPDQLDFFTDTSIVTDPYPYFEFLSQQGPVWREPVRGVVVVTGLREALEVYRDHGTFSSCNASTGPFAGLPVEADDDDITSLIETYRDRLPMHEFMSFLDPPTHTRYRALMARLFSPIRMRENEEYMWRLADLQLGEFVANGKCEFINAYSKPFTILVIADLLGVPEADREQFRDALSSIPSAGTLGEDEEGEVHRGVQMPFLQEVFTGYIEDRRREPRDDVLTRLALAEFPDGTMPEVIEMAREAGFIFVAGGETTARLLATALQYLGERPELQQRLRDRRQLIPNFVEETLRMQSPVKSHFRMARRTTRLGGVDIPAGTTVMLLIGAINRDPRRFEQHQELRIDRANSQDHVAFGRGVHTCLGQALARAEVRISLNRILDRMADISISEAMHGPREARRYDYDPTFIFRGLKALHLEFTAVEN